MNVMHLTRLTKLRSFTAWRNRHHARLQTSRSIMSDVTTCETGRVNDTLARGVLFYQNETRRVG